MRAWTAKENECFEGVGHDLKQAKIMDLMASDKMLSYYLLKNDLVIYVMQDKSVCTLFHK